MNALTNLRLVGFEMGTEGLGVIAAIFCLSEPTSNEDEEKITRNL